MNDTAASKDDNWVNDDNLFFNLSPAKLAKILETALDTNKLSAAQKLYARTVLLNVASASVPIMEEKLRMQGKMPARMLSPAHSIARMSPYETSLYDLIEKGDVENITSIAQPQQITATAHPNFSRSRDLSTKCRELITMLGDMNKKDVEALSSSGQLPASAATLVADIKSLLAPRTKRKRYDELQETTLDFIPTALEGASRQLDIIRDRKRMISGEELTFNNLNQLDAVAALLPEYNTWFVDGDGKRICHAYDSEVAIPAIKRVAYEQYAKILNGLPQNIDGFPVEQWKHMLDSRIKTLGSVENLAHERMDAFNAMDEALRAYRDNSSSETLRDKYQEALAAAKGPSERYQIMLHSPWGETGQKITDFLTEDLASKMRQELGKALQKVYDGEVTLTPNEKKTTEELYIKLTRYGNFPIHPQRRENAREYKEVFQYLVQRQDCAFKSIILRDVAPAFHYSEDDIDFKLQSDPKFYSAAVEAVAKNIKADPQTRKILFDIYWKLSHKLESRGHDVQSLEYREFLTLDALGHFRMANLYPEAFKGGFVVAEFAQPNGKILKSHDEAAIKEDVIRLAGTDMTLQVALAHGMGAPKATLIPLHEDPATIQYAPDAQGVLRQGPVLDYLKEWIGADTPEQAEAKAVRYFDSTGKPAILNAYQYLLRFGTTDEELRHKGLDVEKLKQTRILRGPYDMEACSDIGKRATIMGSELVEQSIREKALMDALHPIHVGDTDYIIVKPKYLGQGGSIARATEVPMDTEQATMQGEHLHNLTPQALANYAHNRMLARINLVHDPIREALLTPDIKERRNQVHEARMEEATGGAAFHVSNLLGYKGHAIRENERELMMKAIDDRIASTRDDKERYNAFLEKYGEPAPNDSARPNAKVITGTEPDLFGDGRAIGIAAKEQGVYPNIIGFASIFEFSTRGSVEKRAVTPGSIQEIRDWIRSDPYMQQMVTAACVTANMVDIEEKWKRGDITYNEANGGTLTKDGVTVPLETLMHAYKDKSKTELTVEGVCFDAADLVMAYHTEQFRKLTKGLMSLFPGTKNLLELFHPAQRETIALRKELGSQILKAMHDPSIKGNDKKLVDGAYYVLSESGGIYESPGVLEKAIAQTGSARG